MSDALELSRFRVAEDSEEKFLASYPACAQALHQFEGFKNVRLARLDDGSYVFVATWAKREHCQTAMERAMNVDAISHFLAHISEEISMDFGDIVEFDRRVAAAA